MYRKLQGGYNYHEVHGSVLNIINKNKERHLFTFLLPKKGFSTAEIVISASSQISEKDIKSWFSKVESNLNEKDFYSLIDNPAKIFNGDETAYMLCPKQAKVVAKKGCKDVYEIDIVPAKSNLTVTFFIVCNLLMVPQHHK